MTFCEVKNSFPKLIFTPPDRFLAPWVGKKYPLPDLNCRRWFGLDARYWVWVLGPDSGLYIWFLKLASADILAIQGQIAMIQSSLELVCTELLLDPGDHFDCSLCPVRMSYCLITFRCGLSWMFLTDALYSARTRIVATVVLMSLFRCPISNVLVRFLWVVLLYSTLVPGSHGWCSELYAGVMFFSGDYHTRSLVPMTSVYLYGWCSGWCARQKTVFLLRVLGCCESYLKVFCFASYLKVQLLMYLYTDILVVFRVDVFYDSCLFYGCDVSLW